MFAKFRGCVLPGLFLSFIPALPAAVGVRVVMGLGDQPGVEWNGSATVRGGRLRAVDGWRFEGQDAIASDLSWKLSIHPIRLFGGAQQQRQPPAVANGVVLWLEGESEQTEIALKTSQGAFSLRLTQIPHGVVARQLDGRVVVDRIPPSTRITQSRDEQDYPAAAVDATGAVWVAYLEFKHHPDHQRLRLPLTDAPSSFDDMKLAPGGDQVMLVRHAAGSWGSPIAISASGGDLYRPAVAVDGKGRPWVFWSSNEKGNFDLYARAVENGNPGRTVRLTTEPGADVNPVAATDARGRVWVAWQGWRGGRAAIVASVQEGDGFSRAVPVSVSQANEWNPAIAADKSGRVSVVWDSYRNGNYDVYMRTATANGAWGAEKPVAASARYEAYASAAYDSSGRLWVAWEEGGERWGKDFGAYDTGGLALYQGRAVRVRVFDREGRAHDTSVDIGTVLPGIPAQRADSAARQAEVQGWERPDPNNAKNREPSRAATNVQAPRNSMPRVQVDGSGRVWVAVRSAHPVWWSPIGTVWSEWAVSYDGARWTGPVFIANSDNLLDNRPALVAPAAGELMIVGSSDGRRVFPPFAPAPGGGAGAAKKAGQKKQAAKQQQRAQVLAAQDSYQNDLHASVVSLPPAAGAATVKPGGAVAVAGAQAADRQEQAATAAIRALRVPSGPASLRVVRGEFHRHSEVSMDGGSDGSIIDQWRYAIDAAAMEWVGCCDHDNGGGREYSWWTTQKLSEVFHTAGKFVSMFSYERSVAYPEGHRNVVFAERGIRPLPRLPKTSEEESGRAPDTQMLYRYLKQFDGVVASHTSGTNMGTDWRDHDPQTEPVVEIYQGDRQNYEMPDAPRSNSEKDSIGGWRPKGFVNLALEMGYKMGFQASSDHISTHLSYCNVLARDLTREAILDGLKKRHVYGATDNILADVRSGEHIMGDSFATRVAPELRVKLAGTAPFSKVHVIKDNRYVYTTEPKKAAVEFTWKDNAPAAGKTSYYYVRGEQADGNIVWASPMWITYQP
jgi:hypothetical protein